jgi:hypothetical protein
MTFASRHVLAGIALASLFFIGVAYPASAQNSIGIVPCNGTDCQACNLVQLGQNIINFLLGLSIPIAIVLIAYGGILYFTSAQNHHNIDKAKKIFTTALTGFVIALGSYLIVETVLHAILTKDYWDKWNVVECKNGPRDRPGSTRENSYTIGDVFSQAVTTFTLGPRTPSATTTGDDTRGGEGRLPLSGSGKDPVSTNGVRPYAQQLAGICAQQGLSNCSMALAIMAVESQGRASVISPAGAVGLMQILPSTARTLDPGLAGLPTSEVIRLLQDPAYNMTLGVRYIIQLQRQFGMTENAIAAYNGGPGANRQSKSCPGETYWHCTKNAGYAETRNYVPKVLATLANLL